MSDGAWKIQELASEGLPDRAAELGQLFPEAMTDGKLDIGKLKLLLGETVDESPERYGLTWPGKRDAIRLAQKQSTATLKPMAGESVDVDTTRNVIIEGDNLEVLKLLQKSYYGKVKMVFIDPPYNTGNDFVYDDDFAQPTESYLQRSGQVDGSGFQTGANREAAGRFHSDWLSMMYPRLVLSRSLLTSDGVLFVSIGDDEAANLREILDEIFGTRNFVANIVWQSRTSISDDLEISPNHNHVMVYSRNRESLTFWGESLRQEEYSNPDNDSRGPWKLVPLDANKPGGDTFYEVRNPDTGQGFWPPQGRSWAINPKSMQALLDDDRIKFGLKGDSAPKKKLFLAERTERGDTRTPSSILLNAGTTKDGSNEVAQLFGSKRVFDYPKPVALIQRLVQYGSRGIKDSLVLDFFAGSGTTAHAVMQQNAEDGGNRRFILVQLPEKTDNPDYPTIAGITRERVRRAGRKIKEEAGDKAAGLDTGFRAFRLAESNFRNWDSDRDTFLSEELDFYVDNINSGASDDDVVHEILLKAGVPLDVDLEKIKIAGEDVYVAMGGLFVVSAARKISQELVDGLLALEPWPVQVVLLDTGFGDNDSLKLNARHQFASRRPEADPDKDNALRTV